MYVTCVLWSPFRPPSISVFLIVSTISTEFARGVIHPLEKCYLYIYFQSYLTYGVIQIYLIIMLTFAEHLIENEPSFNYYPHAHKEEN